MLKIVFIGTLPTMATRHKERNVGLFFMIIIINFNNARNTPLLSSVNEKQVINERGDVAQSTISLVRGLG
jgi:hypothetical protein